jgi:hypothetical protein
MRSPLSPWFVALIVCLLLVPTFASAQLDSLETPPPTRDDRGFLFRVAAGPCYGGAFESNFSGPGADASLAIGGFISHSFALHLTVLGSALFAHADDAHIIEENPDQNVYTLGGGVGVTYYSSGGVYGSFSYMAGAQKLSKESWDGYATIAELLVGKEWGQGEVGYGVALGLIGGIGAAENSDALFSGSASIRFSMTVR